MSGPKCTEYELEQQRKRELERKRLQKEKQKNLQLLSTLKERINTHQYLHQTHKNQLLAGIQEAERITQENKYLAARKKIKGAESYLQAIEKNRQKVEDKVDMARLLYKSLPNEKKQLLLNEIYTINSYNEIMDDPIRQRVDLYSDIIQKSIKTNTDLSLKNERNISIFIDQVDQIKNEHDQLIAEKEYVQNVLGEIIGAKNMVSSNNISGSIGGTPVNINFGSDGKIIFDISDNTSDCHKVLDTINKGLRAKEIDLGDIYVENTGNTIRLNEPRQTNVQAQTNRAIQR